MNIIYNFHNGKKKIADDILLAINTEAVRLANGVVIPNLHATLDPKASIISMFNLYRDLLLTGLDKKED